MLWPRLVSSVNNNSYLLFIYIPLTQSLRRYIVEALEECGAFSTPGSTRSAATSRARAMGAPMATILEAGDWEGAEVFKKHYYHALLLSFLETVWS